MPDDPVATLTSTSPDDVFADAIDAFARARVENTRLLEALAARMRVSSSDIRALFFLATEKDVTPKRVSAYLRLTTGAMTSLIDRLERAGLARRVAHPSDRRSLFVELTDHGLEFVGLGSESYRRAFEAAIHPDEVALAGRLLHRLADTLSGEADAALES